jgi:hypothetical protein
MHSHFTMILSSFHFTTLAPPSHPRHSLLPFTYQGLRTMELDITNLLLSGRRHVKNGVRVIGL